jgi:DNA gyrase subunit A
MVSQEGMIKKVVLSEFANPRRSGITAANLKNKDLLKDARLTDGRHDIIIGTSNGMAIRFHEEEIRPMGRSAAGVRGIRLGKGDSVVGTVTLQRKGTSILVATERGYGKRSEEEEYRVSHRGGKGIKTVKVTDKTGKMAVIREVLETDDIVVVTEGGMVIRQHASDVRMAGRNTQGVRLIRLQDDDSVADVAVVVAEEEEEKKIAEAAEAPKPASVPNKRSDEKSDAKESTPVKHAAPSAKAEKKTAPGTSKSQKNPVAKPQPPKANRPPSVSSPASPPSSRQPSPPAKAGGGSKKKRKK